MKRFFGEKQGEFIKISEGEFLHLKKVLRLGVGDKVIACLNDEYDYFCEIAVINKSDCLLKILSKEICPALPKKEIVLFQMLPKKEYLDNIIAKSIELGVSKIVPFISEYCMIKTLKKERINAQIITASKQCERSKLIEVDAVAKIEALPELLKDFDLALFAYENAEKPFDAKILENKHKIAVIIGNEAGFSEKEAQMLEKYCETISLSKRILRCDTAVTATLALVSILSQN